MTPVRVYVDCGACPGADNSGLSAHAMDTEKRIVRVLKQSSATIWEGEGDGNVSVWDGPPELEDTIRAIVTCPTCQVYTEGDSEIYETIAESIRQAAQS